MGSQHAFNRCSLLVILWTIGLTLSQESVFAQTIVQLPLKSDNYYGMTVWSSLGEQMLVSNSTVWGYGVNLKYSPIGFYPYKYDVEKDSNIIGKVIRKTDKSVQTETKREAITKPDEIIKYPPGTPDIWQFDTLRNDKDITIKIRRTHVELFPGTDWITRIDFDTTIQLHDGPMYDSCEFDTIPICRIKPRYCIRASVGIGYLEYHGLRLPSPSVPNTFDISAPYAGIYVSVELPGDYMHFVIAYTSSFPSSEIVARYDGALQLSNDTTITDFPISYKLPTVATHELAMGLSFSYKDIAVFLEGYYTYYKVSNIQFTPITKTNGFANEALQETLGNTFDLSFRGLKLGASLSF